MNEDYLIAIQRLEPIILNWFDKEELDKHVLFPNEGLCTNTTYSTDENYFHCYNDSILYPCIRDYLKLQGCSDTKENLWFPIEGNPEKYMKSSDSNTLYDNPKRLHFAVYMLSWLRQHSLEVQHEEELKT